MIKINNVPIKHPSSLKVEIYDVDGESNVNAKGEVLRDRIAIKRKLDLEWNHLSNEDISIILNAVKDVFFEVEYPDPMEGKVIKKTFYVGNRTSPVYTYSNNEVIWTNLSFGFEEK